MTAEQFLDALRTRFDAPWLADAVGEVERRMDGDGGHDFGHLHRVFCNACHIVDADDRPADFAAVVAAIVFHDVVNLPKDHPERHTASSRSADVAIACLQGTGLDLELVTEAIRCHSFSAGFAPERYEAQVVADADNLESVGAFGIARTFYVAGRMGSAIVDGADPWARARPLDDRRFAVDHFGRKLLRLRDQMHTPAGRALADERHAFMEAFLAQLGRELAESASGD